MIPEQIRDLASIDAREYLEATSAATDDFASDERRCYFSAFVRELMDAEELTAEDIGLGAADQVVREGGDE